MSGLIKSGPRPRSAILTLIAKPSQPASTGVSSGEMGAAVPASWCTTS
jgi:hypothetical protein